MNKQRTIFFILPFILPLISCNRGIPTKVEFELPPKESVSIHTDFQKEFLKENDNDEFISKQDQNTFARTSASKPNPVKFVWEYKTDSLMKPTKTTLNISLDPDMASNVFHYETNAKELDVYNLRIDSTYYYTISLNYDGTVFTSEIGEKSIADEEIRNLYIDGVRNVRDIGGYKVDNGKIRQGLLYRSAEFNGTFGSVVTDLGKEQLVNTLGIKSDIDLRRTKSFSNPKDEIYSITESPLGSSVNWVSLPMYFGGMNIFTNNSNAESIKAFFEYLSKPDSYPAIFHCVRGTDRTGALSYALGALLGMDEDQLMKDYLFSNFDDLDSDPLKTTNISGAGMYVYQINKEDGSSLSEKAANYLIKRTGVSLETLESIKEILIEKF